MNILYNFVFYASILLCLSGLINLFVSLITLIKKKRREEYENRRLIINRLVNRHTYEDYICEKEELSPIIAKSILSDRVIETENKRREIAYRISRMGRTQGVFRDKYKEFILNYWIKRMNSANKKINNLNIDIMRYTKEIDKVKEDQTG